MANETELETSNEQTATDDALNPDVTVEDIGPARKCLSIEIPAEQVAKKLDENYQKLRSDAQIPGFRKGRAPRGLIEKRFGTAVRDDVRGQLINESFSKVVEGENLEVIGPPDIKDAEDIALPDSGPMKFKVEVEVAPNFDLPKLEGIAIEKVIQEISDEQVDQEIEKIRSRLGTVIDAPDGKLQPHDVAISAVSILEGENAGSDAPQIAHDPKAQINVPGESDPYGGQVAGILIEDLRKQLDKKTVGDTVSISLTGPATHEDERIRSKPITIVLQISAVKRLEPRPLAEVPGQLGLDSDQQMRKHVRELIQAANDREQRSNMHGQVYKYLIDHVEMELPPDMTSRQAHQLLQRNQMQLAVQGVPKEEIEHQLARMRSASEQDAIQKLKQLFILSQAAKQLEVKVREPEINGVITMMAQQEGRRPERLRQDLRKNDQLENLAHQILELKTLDKLVDLAEVTERKAGTEESAPKTAKTTKKTKEKTG